VGELDFEDKQFALQTLANAWPAMTERQQQCLTFCVMGFTQQQVADVLGITQQAVQGHFAEALRIVKANRAEGL
jgi:DNA-binding CsgD family transcriptional regulator